MLLVFDKGSIVWAWRKTVANKYSNLPGIRELHDFLAVRNHGQDAAMKVRDNCYTCPLKNTPMKIAKGMNASDMALPVCHSVGFYPNCLNFLPLDFLFGFFTLRFSVWIFYQ